MARCVLGGAAGLAVLLLSLTTMRPEPRAGEVHAPSPRSVLAADPGLALGVTPANADVLARRWFQCKCVDTSQSSMTGRVCATTEATATILAKRCYRASRKPKGSVTCDCEKTELLCQKSKGDRCEGL